MKNQMSLQDFKPSLDELRALIKEMEKPKVVKEIWTEKDEFEFNQSILTKDEE